MATTFLTYLDVRAAPKFGNRGSDAEETIPVRFTCSTIGSRLEWIPLVLIAGAPIVLGIVVALRGDTGLGLALLIAALVMVFPWWVFIPRQLQITGREIVILFGLGLHYRVPFDTVDGIVRGRPGDAWRSWGVRLAITARRPARIRRIGSQRTLIVSPVQPERFVEACDAAMAEWRAKR